MIAGQRHKDFVMMRVKAHHARKAEAKKRREEESRVKPGDTYLFKCSASAQTLGEYFFQFEVDSVDGDEANGIVYTLDKYRMKNSPGKLMRLSVSGIRKNGKKIKRNH